MDPLHYYIWLCIVLSYLGVSLVMFVVGRCSPAEWQIGDDTGDGPEISTDFTLRNSLWFALVVLAVVVVVVVAVVVVVVA